VGITIPVAVVLLAVLIATATDLYRYKLYNVFTFPLLLTGLVYHGVTGGMPALWDSVLGALFGFSVLIVFHLMGGVGAGDVKLMAAIGAWLGVLLTFVLFLAASLAAGVYAVVLILAFGRVRETWVNLQVGWLRLKALGRQLAAEERVEEAVKDPDRRRRVIPFAAMVAVGLFALLVWSRFLA
jgi:prepilin peptidase CpaA